MKELKFRVWDGTKYSIEPRLDLVLLNTQTKECSVVGFNKVIQQFTGLYDEKGKNIYEGDIVKIYVSGIYTKGTVIFYKGAFMVEDTCGFKHYPDKWILVELEIIGNIFENPELLKL